MLSHTVGSNTAQEQWHTLHSTQDKAADADRAIAALRPLGIWLGVRFVRGQAAQVSKQMLEALVLVVGARLNRPPELHDSAGTLVIRRRRLFIMLVQRLFSRAIVAHELMLIAPV